MQRRGWSATGVGIALVMVGACNDEVASVPPTDTGASSGSEVATAADTTAVDSATTATAADTAPVDTTPTETTPTETTPAETSPAETSPRPGPTLTFEIEPITIQPGKERQVCRTVNIPGDVAFDIVRFTAEMAGRSHHFNLYKVIDGTALDPVTGAQGVTHDCAPANEQLAGDAAYIFGSATPNRVMETPPGVAFHLEAGQRLILEYHAINYTDAAEVASVKIHLEGASPDVAIAHHAEIFWFANWGFILPPDTETTDTTQCTIPYDVEIFGLMSHFHELGTHFSIDTVRGGQTTEVYEDDDYAHPKYAVFDPPMALDAGDQIQWTCTWFNWRTDTVLPQKTSKDEMCMVFAAGYPRAGLSAEPAQCNVVF